MFWYGSEKNRFRVQRWISIIVLFFALILLISKIYMFVACDGAGYDIVKGFVATGVGCLMFYISNKW
jgi:uncharacterized membrane-anchored protein